MNFSPPNKLLITSDNNQKFKIMKIEEFTDGQIELLQALVQGCNLALYRTGQIRSRDKNHNPIKNIRSDMFEKVRTFLVQKEGLFYINPDIVEQLPRVITMGMKHAPKN